VENDRFGVEMPSVVVAADTTTPRVFGILNIIFSLLGACIAGYALAMAIFMPMFNETMKQARQSAQETAATEIKALEEQVAAAATEEEKEELNAELVLERENLEVMSELEDATPFGAMADPQVRLYGLFNGSTGLFFNLLMFVSGVGLLYRKEWARKLAIWTAGFKIVRLIAMQAYNMLVIIPIQAKHMQAMFEQMDVGNAGAGSADMAGMQGMMYTAWAVVSLVVGCIYPVLTLWFLSRPGVKATCQADTDQSGAEITTF